jgi:ABC-type transport system substrate-binding protein
MKTPLHFRLINAAYAFYARWERWVFLGLGLLFAVSLAILLFRFHRSNTLLVPTTGGTYIEGSVGELRPLNPWFTITNDVNRDIVSLVFSGLLKYNPQTKKIEDDLATLQVSKDGKIYTLQLKEHLFWHDSTEQAPHPVTSDDVLFTFKSIQDPEFPNSLLRQNFKGVSIEKINERTVQFRLEQPYSFFASNLTLGLLPERAFEGVEVKNFDQELTFGFEPIGAGPYKLKSVVQTDLSTEVTLERFPRELAPVYRLDRVVLRIFTDYPTLLSDIRNLDGIRLAPHTEQGDAAVPRRFTARSYTLPQYVALFFNLDRKALKDQNLRLGLRLGTNKQEIVDEIGESVLVDTPLLQIDTSDWVYRFDTDAAQGALFESEWYFPEKIRLQRLLEQRETNGVGTLRVPAVARLETGAVLTVSGSFAGMSREATINGVRLTPNPSNSGAWIAAIPTAGGTGTLKVGVNLLKLVAPDGKILDSAYLQRTIDDQSYRRALEEQQLIDAFLMSRDDERIPEASRVTVQDFFLDGGYLRQRFSTDPVGIRVNDGGERLSLTLLTSPAPERYKQVAEMVKAQWASLGVHVNVDIPATRDEFEERLLKREYDVLLFGQSLLDNLDSYPYWHSSGVQQLTGKRSDLKIDAYNLSQYADFESDALLEVIRKTTNDKERQDALSKLSEVLKQDAPAIVLYTPLYTFAQRDDILGVELGKLSLHSDRFLTLHRWYVKQERIFKAGQGWLSFFGWLSSLFLQRNPQPPV